ncbi:hypothetical protein E0H39_03165 [Rhizobium leguminosarum bv. viciae]|jgi:hypothetical protein|uniref:Transmembrane protein n=1 Tax=Rhizobium leguminosarum bv. viciae TaxID=387 RepID=A0A7G6RJ91_RHILV|nr:hypothetical protein [Rhizobium leguminosarum]ASS53112.1 hypothetical protein CHR56_00045 [Rhizobium leguminosarum bv. viciae]ASS57616.1 hypothetical protein CHR56_25380 [Rhizobium leguminosarum bv. viciae]ASS60530.1 hypothetical protein CHR56_39115 [Rhizobium leguminosarum bv. viciae]QND42323.1 hypothetical protein HB770_10920 [Rhizobium leguminosarum bv. viciae]TBY17462.1 hypothetical protein E0H30_25915 [Rhizobium leguminosarum bv. viciae]
MRNDLSDIQVRLADINRRAAPVLEEHTRLIGALNKGITLVLTVAAFGILTFIAIAPTEQSLKERAIINQEQFSWQK